MLDVYRRNHYVAGLLVHKLQYAFTEVCLDNVYAVAFEIGVHFALLGKHRLALYKFLGVVFMKD